VQRFVWNLRPRYGHKNVISADFHAVYDRNGHKFLCVKANSIETITSQAWNAEDHLPVVTNIVSGAITRFVYGGDGHRVKSVLNGVPTYDVGTHFE